MSVRGGRGWCKECVKKSVARILIDIKNKNPESDIGVNTEDQSSKVANH